MDPNVRKQIGALMQSVVERREGAIRAITRKNQLLVMRDRLAQRLELVPQDGKVSVQAEIDAIEIELKAATRDVEKEKRDVLAFEEFVREQLVELHASEFPEQNRVRAMELLRQRALAQMKFERGLLADPTRLRTQRLRDLNRQMSDLMAQLAAARGSASEAEIDELVRQLDDVLEAIEPEERISAEERRERLVAVVQPFDEELRRLREDGG